MCLCFQSLILCCSFILATPNFVGQKNTTEDILITKRQKEERKLSSFFLKPKHGL